MSSEEKENKPPIRLETLKEILCNASKTKPTLDDQKTAAHNKPSIFMNIEDYIDKHKLHVSPTHEAYNISKFPDLWPTEVKDKKGDTFSQNKSLQMHGNFQFFINLIHTVSRNSIAQEKNKKKD